MSDGFDLNNGNTKTSYRYIPCPELGLGKPLEGFEKADRIPSVKDVLLHLFYQMNDKKKQVSVGDDTMSKIRLEMLFLSRRTD